MKVFLMLFFLLLLGKIQAQQETVRWLTLAEAEEYCKASPKPYLFDFYTDGCGWCKHMEKTTYADPVAVSFINRHFYPVRVDAESADTMRFRDKIYVPVKNGNKYISSLALEMLGGKLSYPTTVFLYDREKVNLVVPGYIEPLKMQGFLLYFVENAWRTVNVEHFLKDFDLVFGTPALQGQKPVDYWITFQDLEKERQKNKKKVLLFLEASWNNSCKMMKKVIFTDSLFAAEAREHFWCLNLDVQSQDTVTFLSYTFHNAGPENNNLHQLAIALSHKILRVPGIYLFDEDGKLLENLYYYMDREKGRMILDYIGNDTFKSMSWQDYVKVREKETL